MRQIFTKAQLKVLWFCGIITSLILIGFSKKPFIGTPSGMYAHYYLSKSHITGYYFDWIQALILPTIIITILLLISFLPQKN